MDIWYGASAGAGGIITGLLSLLGIRQQVVKQEKRMDIMSEKFITKEMCGVMRNTTEVKFVSLEQKLDTLRKTLTQDILDLKNAQTNISKNQEQMKTQQERLIGMLYKVIQDLDKFNGKVIP